MPLEYFWNQIALQLKSFKLKLSWLLALLQSLLDVNGLKVCFDVVGTHKSLPCFAETCNFFFISQLW